MITLVESKTYVAMKAIIGDDDLLDEIQQGFDFILAKDPYYGYSIRGDVDPDIYVFKTQPFAPKKPAFRVLYRYAPSENPNEIELLAIEQLPIDGDD